jgi:hypothetical protein
MSTVRQLRTQSDWANRDSWIHAASSADIAAVCCMSCRLSANKCEFRSCNHQQEDQNTPCRHH